MLEELGAAARSGAPGARLPSIRDLAARHGASPVTVQRAVSALSAAGVVEAHPGRGTFIAGRGAVTGAAPDLRWQELALGATSVDANGLDTLLALPRPGAIPLSSGYLEPALQPIGAVSRALARASRRPGAWARGPVEGDPELRAWFAHEAGGLMQGHDVIVCPGGQAALATTLRAFASPGEPLLVESPTYLGVLAAARSAGLVPVPVPTDADGVVPEMLAATFARTGSRLAYLQPTFANPGGALLAEDRRREVVAVAQRAGAFLIEDDWARDLAIDADPPAPLVAHDRDGHVIYLRSLTKSAAPGLRVGAVAARGAAGARLRTARIIDDFFVSGPLQAAALELVGSPAWRTHLRALRRALADRRDALVAAVERDLPSTRIVGRPRGGLHLWLELPPGTDDVALAAEAVGRGVVVVPGRPWFAAEPPGPHLRLTFGCAPPDLLAEGVRRLGPLLNG